MIYPLAVSALASDVLFPQVESLRVDHNAMAETLGSKTDATIQRSKTK